MDNYVGYLFLLDSYRSVKEKIKLKPCACNFAVSNTNGRQSKVLDKSVSNAWNDFPISKIYNIFAFIDNLFPFIY